uniref:hotdog fold thioesterase n=1 Tax=Thaumasiovibrio occultus TaxID=1891184 RepID=UPI000B351083|nr:hotdog fold thioesterase [Thaumasiovibrio occultus]
MGIWKRNATLAELNALNANTLMATLGIEYCHIDENSLTASMPVGAPVHQPMGLLHGGASVALAESVGSLAANLAVEEGQYCVGLDINANHIKAARSGIVYAKATPVHLGGVTHVWSIDITNESQDLICQSRLTMMVKTAKSRS